MTDNRDVWLEVWADDLLSTLWGRKGTATPAFLDALKRVLEEHEQYILSHWRVHDPSKVPTEPIAPVGVPDTEPIVIEPMEDDVATLIRWMHDGEWFE